MGFDVVGEFLLVEDLCFVDVCSIFLNNFKVYGQVSVQKVMLQVMVVGS